MDLYLSPEEMIVIVLALEQELQLRKRLVERCKLEKHDLNIDLIEGILAKIQVYK